MKDAILSVLFSRCKWVVCLYNIKLYSFNIDLSPCYMDGRLIN